jgi:hypothetical protein
MITRKWGVMLFCALAVLAQTGPASAEPLSCTEPSTTANSGMCEWAVANSSLVLPYYRYHDLKTSAQSVSRAVISVHGRSYDPEKYREHIYNAANDRGRLSQTLVIAPYFCKCDTANLCPDDAGWLCWHSNNADDWAAGANAANDSANINTASFAILDEMITFLAASSDFPNLQTIVVTGQSGGGQTTLKYAMGGTAAPAGITLHYVAANPGSVAYLSGSRPTRTTTDQFPNIIGSFDCDPPDGVNEVSAPPPGVVGPMANLEAWSSFPYSFGTPYDFRWKGEDCTSNGAYDQWPWGLGDVSTNDYMRTIVKSGDVARSRYLSRSVTILSGINDNEYFDPSHCEQSEWNCAHATQGQSRVERNALFFSHVCDFYDCSKHGFATVDADVNGDGIMDGIGHGGLGMYRSEATRHVLFNDAKPPGIWRQKPIKAVPGKWLKLSLSDLVDPFPAGSELLVEAGSGYGIFKQNIRPAPNFRGRLFVPVRVRSPITGNPADGTFISNRFLLRVSVDTRMEWLFPGVLSGILSSR